MRYRSSIIAANAVGLFVLASHLPWCEGDVVSAATIRVAFDDGPMEGFNDPTASLPVGGNDAPTVGGQRRRAVAYAAQIWADRLESDVEIDLEVRFDPLTCDERSAVVGQASPSSVHSDFAGAPLPATLYPAALANRLAGMDLCPPGSCRSSEDIRATFNSSFGESCNFFGEWYYGLDAAPGRDQVDMVTVALHEIGHGLGFVSLVDGESGERFMDMNDGFSNFVEAHASGATFDALDNAERVEAVTSVRDLHFVGPAALAGGERLVSGLGAGGHIRLYAPATLNPGSSLSHFDQVLAPDELMEPALDSPTHDIGLAAEVLQDIGWELRPLICEADCDRDQRVSSSDLVLAVRVALREAEVADCGAADRDSDGQVGVDELVVGVRNALEGCGGRVVQEFASSARLSGTISSGPRCGGDCDGDGRVSVGELVSGVNIGLGRSEVALCPDMDANGDGRVGIAELIAAVASALDGCPCPFDLLDDSAGAEEACVFAGRWNSQCGDSGLPATFSVQEGLVGVAIVTGPTSPTLTFFGQSVSGNEAAMIGFMFGDEAVQSAGSIRLSDDRRRLLVEPASAPQISIDECDLEFYEGDIDRIVSTLDSGRTAGSMRTVWGAAASAGFFSSSP